MYPRTWPLITLLALGMVACTHHSASDSGPGPLVARQLPSSLKADAGTLVAGNTAFAFDLYKALPTAGSNAVSSPHSVSTALAMTWAGARGRTADQMATVLHFDQDPARIHALFGALQASLDTGETFNGYSLRFANRLWGTTGYVWLPAFLTTTREDYGAELQELDFASDPEAARQTINLWVQAHTGGAISGLMPPGSIQNYTNLVLTNAMAFKGLWATRFDPAQTRVESFQLESGASVQVPTMHLTAPLDAASLTGLNLVELPFRGGDLAMVFLQPSGGRTVSDLESDLSPANLAQWTASLHQGTVSVALPRFSFTGSYDLKRILSAMGMPDAFDSSVADFSGMDGLAGLFLDTLTHKARVEVDEEGATAAAATGGTIVPVSIQPLAFDHPFLFILRDKVTGALLLIGKVADPSQVS